VEEVAPHYMIVVDRVNNLDTMEVQVELNSEFYTDEIRGIERLTKKIAHAISQAIGLNAKITIVQPGSLKRSEGKAVHVIDKRKYD
jgi:phenylacetate-CoA ligase